MQIKRGRIVMTKTEKKNWASVSWVSTKGGGAILEITDSCAGN